MLYLVKYTVGKISGERVVSALSAGHAHTKAVDKLREEYPAECCKSERVEIVIE